MKPRLIEDLARKTLGRNAIRDTSACEDVAALLAPLPYENLTKFIALLTGHSGYHLRMGEEVIEEHLAHGFGGTCFSLTQTACEIFTAAGIDSQRITGSMKAGAHIHAALIVHTGSGPDRILDPGYLIPSPLPMPEPDGQATRREWGGKVYILEAKGENLHLSVNGEEKVIYHSDEKDETPFFDAWRRSFSLMKDLIITRQRGGRLDYLRNTFYRRTEVGRREQKRLKGDPAGIIAAIFGLDLAVVKRALILYQESHPWKKVIRNR